ncbi:ribonuclease R [Ligilactobacillus pabuli]|uniref:Ribonuclease R n=1 Tax=Ligilactobacillus pabuli TaxID=2886039 RepID=A0ABQ5JH33_9LACO|nr:ribonuclease R [Ligilactobacillus pabuli]GKS80807.1 ribonuclease R [Ligilactobacillus pabuli]
MNKENIIEKLTGFFEAEPTQKFSVEQMVQKLGMEGAGQFKFVVQALTQLEHDKKVLLDDEGRFSWNVAADTAALTGIFHANDRGYGFVTVDPEQPDYFINPTATMSALNGDEVRIEETGAGDPKINKRPEGKIVEIIAHSLTQVVGEFQDAADENLPAGILGLVHLKDKKLSNFKFLLEDKGLHPVAGEVILADISAYPSAALPGLLKGVAVKVLGNVNDPGMDILQVVYEHEIPHEFPDDVMEQAEKTPDHVTEPEREGRVDLTDQKLVTIDSIESKDLDDAVNVWKLPNGNFHLGVHIADVSHYVQPGTPLDREAYERGTSVYLTDRVIPMLPAKLSNGICSLNPHVERCAMTCEMEIDAAGKIVNHKIFPSLIKSTERMTYIAINKIVESHDEKTMEQYQELVPMFQDMAELHKILLKMRKRRGAIEFDDTEAKIIVDEQGHPTDIQLRERGTSERMVESFMLAANETVAAHFHALKVPFVYRIHETPKPEKIENLFEILGTLGIEVAGKKTDVNPKMMQSILKKVAGKPEEAMVSTMVLRSMQQAKYSPQPLGHFGIAADDYTHFTSPIRRYPDLMVHRLIHLYLEQGLGQEQQDKYADQLDSLTTHTSEAERRGISAERDTDAMKKAEFMSDHVGEEFDAVVSSVTKFGMFIALPNTVEGLIHISQIQDDYYEYLEKQMALVGRRTKQTYRIGQPVKVKLINVNVEQKEVDFTLAEPGQAPKSDLLDGVELPDRRPKRNNDHRGHRNNFHRQGGSNHKRPNGNNNRNRRSNNGGHSSRPQRQGGSRSNYKSNQSSNRNR